MEYHRRGWILDRLKKARKEAGLDQEEVAKALGITHSSVSKIECEQRRVHLFQLKAFAGIYRKKIEDLLK